jgi:hypothetical protein
MRGGGRVDWGNTCMPLLCIIQYTTAAKQNRLFARLRKNTPLNEPLLEYVATPFYWTIETYYRILYVQKLVHKIFVKCLILSCGRIWPQGDDPPWTHKGSRVSMQSSRVSLHGPRIRLLGPRISLQGHRVSLQCSRESLQSSSESSRLRVEPPRLQGEPPRLQDKPSHVQDESPWPHEHERLRMSIQGSRWACKAPCRASTCSSSESPWLGVSLNGRRVSLYYIGTGL